MNAQTQAISTPISEKVRARFASLAERRPEPRLETPEPARPATSEYDELLRARAESAVALARLILR